MRQWWDLILVAIFEMNQQIMKYSSLKVPLKDVVWIHGAKKLA